MIEAVCSLLLVLSWPLFQEMAVPIVKQEEIWSGYESSEDSDFAWEEVLARAMVDLERGKDSRDDRTSGTSTSPISPRVTRSRSRQLLSIEHHPPVLDMHIKVEPSTDELSDSPLASPSRKKKRTCQVCQHVFSRLQNLRRHQTKGCKNMCGTCGRTLGTNTERREHRKECNACAFCNYKVGSSTRHRSYNLTRHMRLLHSEQLKVKNKNTQA